ncbi:exodeoxyribonuclease III [Helcobacillus massiliensis]|uniref:Exodeoxyribonuclease-3 n=1 Tax=Helcobacillus massiliensis TaxID=521392 RepID=A0A839QPL8_9MICO|nr:exodeoxyribonuclease III [Helcobacillus massiliensis]MCG7427473.1 exodeoxyribonuclease III [Helcobacillus sp. ACRRO]MBB3021922.1 exodeoxyribonuclease-3 [Helcobacillus massiliensis]MCT1557523.1 exodeoxyribonuclease III [Helcobacillus massiliensis]MCT2037410.1 exodeoxyribonuclease III [Helcobacillus massiliensis]MCT2331962.1 exodeoxyribonuclease III [Helcobacillus massiliensis]
MTFTVATVNVNGIRAAVRKGMHDWIEQAAPDVITLQEVRAPDELVAPLIGEGWNVVHAEAAAKGRAGVAICSRHPFLDTRLGIGVEYYATAGRWVEADITSPFNDDAVLTIISAYVHTGNAEDEQKMSDKYGFMDAMVERIGLLREAGNHVLLTGDLNVAHTERDIKNWKGNLKKAGFLPTERAYYDRMFDQLDWVDIGRTHAGDVPGPYTWWSNRGKAFDNDAGWRIDYQIASRDLAGRAVDCRVDRAPSYDTRWSDHAPLVVDYRTD